MRSVFSVTPRHQQGQLLHLTSSASLLFIGSDTNTRYSQSVAQTQASSYPNNASSVMNSRNSLSVTSAIARDCWLD